MVLGRIEDLHRILCVDITRAAPNCRSGYNVSIGTISLSHTTQTSPGGKQLEVVSLLHNDQGLRQVDRHKRRPSGHTYQRQLKKSVVLADRGGTDLGRGQRKVPIPRKCFRRWKRYPTIVDGRNTESDVSTENDARHPNCSRALSVS